MVDHLVWRTGKEQIINRRPMAAVRLKSNLEMFLRLDMLKIFLSSLIVVFVDLSLFLYSLLVKLYSSFAFFVSATEAHEFLSALYSLDFRGLLLRLLGTARCFRGVF